MKLRYLFSVLLVLLFGISSTQAISFASPESGFFKKHAIQTENFRFEYSDLVKTQSDLNSNGIADIIEVIANSAEQAYDVLVNEMGYSAPVLPVTQKTIVILDDLDTYLLPNSLGITSLLSNGEPYVAIDPFLTADSLKVTMAHEFYHVLQFSMGTDFAYTSQGVNFAEASATWSETHTFPEIKDYARYLDDFFKYPDYSLFASYIPSDTLFQYALSAWYIFLDEKYNSNIVREIWESYQTTVSNYNDALELYDVVRNELIKATGVNLNNAYMEFALWNLDLDFYEDGSLYPQVFILDSFQMEELTLVDESYAPALYGSNYLYFPNTGNQDDFYFTLVKPEGVSFAVTLVPVKNNDFLGSLRQRKMIDTYENMESAIKINSKSYDGVVAIVSALDADFDAVSSEDLVFDEGFLYYYFAQYGIEPNVETDVWSGLSTDEKAGEEGLLHDHGGTLEGFQLEVESYNENSVTLSWNRPSTDTAKYEISYSNSSGSNFTKIIDKAHITSTTLSSLAEGELHTFQVFAYDSSGEDLIDSSNVISVIPEEWLFTDLSFLAPNYDAISSLVEMGIFSGYPDGSFQPHAYINRAELLKILIEGRGINPNPNLYKNCFPDVAEDWYAKYVCYAKSQGWISGYPDGTFKPADTVNKVESLKILFNVYESGLKEGSFVASLNYNDVDSSAWYAIYLWEASRLGILEESAGTAFSPAEGKKRASIAENLYRYLTKLNSL